MKITHYYILQRTAGKILFSLLITILLLILGANKNFAQQTMPTDTTQPQPVIQPDTTAPTTVPHTSTAVPASDTVSNNSTQQVAVYADTLLSGMANTTIVNTATVIVKTLVDTTAKGNNQFLLKGIRIRDRRILTLVIQASIAKTIDFNTISQATFTFDDGSSVELSGTTPVNIYQKLSSGSPVSIDFAIYPEDEINLITGNIQMITVDYNAERINFNLNTQQAAVVEGVCLQIK